MGISNITQIRCDLVKNGKPCGKVFFLPENPKLNTPGTEKTVSLVVAETNKQYFFCNIYHLLEFGVQLAKNGPPPEAETAPPPNVIPFNGKLAASLSLEDLQAAGIIEPVESDVPPAPENLNLEGE